jgi:fibronectin-binding autotransporter adhesin
LFAIAMVGQPAALTHASSYIWTGAENSNWDFSSFNWSDGVDPVLWQNGNTAVFNGSAPGTIGVSSIAVAGIEVSSSGYSFTGGSIDFGESGAPFQIDNDVTIDSILNGDTLVKTGNGSLTLSSNFTFYFGGVTVSAGAVVGTTASLRGNITNNALVTFDQVLDGEYFGSMSGSGSLTKIGSGAVTFSAINGYTGATAVNGGQLLVNGELGNTAVSVTSGGLLGGSGRILGNVTVDSLGTMSPGNSPGILTVGSLSLSAGSQTVMEITGTSSSLYDQIVGTGAGPLSYGGSLDLVMSGSYADQTTFHLFSNFSSSNGDFSSLTMASGSYFIRTLASWRLSPSHPPTPWPLLGSPVAAGR